MFAPLRGTAAAMMLACSGAWAAPNVTLNGSMGDRALLMIDGQPRMVALGATSQGVKLLAVGPDEAQVEVGGQRLLLRIGAAPVSVGSAGTAAGGSQIVLAAGPGGHFMTNGKINGRSVNFMVDTGASVIAISQVEAERIGLDWRNGGQRGLAHTANGTVQATSLVLSSVRIGDVEIANVQAMVIPAAMPYVLLGNSYLTRFQMKRDNDTLRLDKR
jgi:aspartyl protease family protein